MSVVQYQLIDNLGVIRLNNPPVNALSQALRLGLLEAINAAQGDESQALVILCEGRTFIAGADIREFNLPPQAPSLPDLIETIENSRKPVIAAIHGNALGGGLEVALACHYRCALPTAKLGLPEVKLGLIPGAGGTQRATRLIGVEAALELITSGKSITAQQAVENGLIDKLLDGELEPSALAYARNLVKTGASPKRTRDISLAGNAETSALLESYRQRLAKRARGQIAPQHIIDCIQDAVNLPFEKGIAAERKRFLECKQSPQSAAMRHIFFAEREAAKVSGLADQAPPKPIESVAVIGGGTMGAGIAICIANAGLPVTLLDINQEALQRGLDTIEKTYQQSVSKGKLSEAHRDKCLSLIKGTTEYSDLSQTDLVIEAVFENLEIKQEVFRQLDTTCKAGAILATNTSYQDINQIAAVTTRPQDVIGLHFFSPAHVMKLLEVIRGEHTADNVILTAMQLAKKIGKIPVLAEVCYGFIGNRMLRQYMAEAQRCLIEGASPEQIDTVMERWGMAMGPLAVADLAGLDISYKARQALSDAQKGDPKTYCIADALVEMGRLGQKSGLGYYRYNPETRTRTSDPEVMSVVESQALAHGITRREITDKEILERLVFTLVNEGANILAEGIAQRPGDIDVVYAFGYGFPVFRGGPMHYADSIGLKRVYDTLCEYRQYKGASWQPAPLLKELADSGKSFAQWIEENR